MAKSRYRNLHLATAIVAAGLTAAFYRKRIWRYIFGGIATAEIANFAYHSLVKEEPDEATETPVSEALKSAFIDGIRMRWEEHGAEDNVPVVFIHGFPTGPRLWRYVIPRLAFSGARCFAWEMVGYGSSWPESGRRDISLARQVEYLYSWLKHQNIHKAIFVGHDLGGGVVQRLFVEHPGYCMGLVLIDSVAYDNWPVPAVKFARSRASLISRLPLFLLKQIFIEGLIAAGHDHPRRGSESLQLHWRHYDHARGAKVFARQLRSLRNKDTASLEGKLSRIKIPAKVIWGELDRLDTESGRKLADQLGVEMAIIPGAKHFTPEDHPDVIAAAVKDLLVETEENQQVKTIKQS